ncbi:MAG TPA: phospholipase D-like domain-containing protein [Dongiaceae bacterium]|nr:phospholipase D-like domain-containing protein [Dongiaceae bacterium]
MADQDFLAHLEPIGAVLGPLLHVLLAGSVTVHVLERKRDVAASIAWIGLAWLSPIIGSALYLLFGVNRVQRRAFRAGRRHGTAWMGEDPATFLNPRHDHFAPLERAIGVLTGRPPRLGNNVQMLRNGDEAYPLMLEAIASAKVSIAFSNYIFEADAAGGQFIAALTAAKARGVEVRVIVDGIGSGYWFSPVYQKLTRAGIPVARFMHTWVPWRMAFLNLRSHKKILVADGMRAFIGGLNISNANLLASTPPDPVRDMHFAVTGPVVAQITEAFAADWYFCTGERLKGESWMPALAETGTAAARIITSGPDQDIYKIEFAMLQAIGCAQHSIKILTPYFLPDERLMTALVLAAMAGVAVDLVIPECCDHPMMDWAMRAHIAPLLRAGGRVWRAPLPFEHSKLFVIDDGWSLIGSANWDMRSLRLNFELNMEVCCPQFGALVAGAIERRQANPLTLAELRARPLAEQLRDSAVRLLLPYL